MAGTSWPADVVFHSKLRWRKRLPGHSYEKSTMVITSYYAWTNDRNFAVRKWYCSIDGCLQINRLLLLQPQSNQKRLMCIFGQRICSNKGILGKDTIVAGCKLTPFAVGQGLMSIMYRAELTYQPEASTAPSYVSIALWYAWVQLCSADLRFPPHFSQKNDSV